MEKLLNNTLLSMASSPLGRFFTQVLPVRFGLRKSSLDSISLKDISQNLELGMQNRGGELSQEEERNNQRYHLSNPHRNYNQFIDMIAEDLGISGYEASQKVSKELFSEGDNYVKRYLSETFGGNELIMDSIIRSARAFSADTISDSGDLERQFAFEYGIRGMGR